MKGMHVKDENLSPHQDGHPAENVGESAQKEEQEKILKNHLARIENVVNSFLDEKGEPFTAKVKEIGVFKELGSKEKTIEPRVYLELDGNPVPDMYFNIANEEYQNLDTLKADIAEKIREWHIENSAHRSDNSHEPGVAGE